MSLDAAPDRESGRHAIAELCAAFEQDLSYYKSDGFDETSARQRFIDPFFAALGWDVADRARRGPYADVLLEYRLRGGDRPTHDEDKPSAASTGVRRPDYSFRIDGERQFFVEAKRPSVDVATLGPIFQVKSYGWSAGTAVAVLTDFEDLRVYDCRYPPSIEAPQTGLHPEFSLGFREYVDHWDQLWGTFSRQAVAEGALRRYAAEAERSGGRLAVDRAFLADFGRWRSQLAQELAVRNPEIDVWQLNEATQRTLDRLVFIRVCEDRRLEPEEILRPLIELSDPYREFIARLPRMRESYNGGLFEPDLVDGLTVGSAIFAEILRGLHTPWSPYRFDVLGVEILGSIYERALGSTITLDEDRRVAVELKPEVRKSGGVYYTPRWVVEEVVRRTVGPLIDDRPPRDIFRTRVVDPACGSGSFLIGAFDYFVRRLERYYTEHPTVDRSLHLRDSAGSERLTAEGKARLLRRCVFGVDVDPAAVEVTQLSLYLRSLETDAPELLRTQMRFGAALLPSLEANIRCGNSLVGTDFYAQQQLELDAEEEHRLRPFDWRSREHGFGEVFAEGGFSAVIGNPPYFNVDATYGANHPVPRYLRRTMSEVWTDKTDIYYFFLHRGIELAEARLGFIVSRAFLEADKARPLRRWLTENARLEQIVDFGGQLVFEDAGIATAIVNFDTSRAHEAAEVQVMRLPTAGHDEREVVEALRTGSPPFLAYQRRAELGGRAWSLPDEERGAIYDALDAAGDPLTRVCFVGKGMETGANAVFGKLSADDISRWGLPSELLKERARNSDIQQFYIESSGEFLLYLEDVDRYESLPEAVRHYLEEPAHRSKLEGRAAHRRGNCEWWRYTWPLHRDRYRGSRLISPYRTGHLRFALDEHFDVLSLTDSTVAFRREGVHEDDRYLLALLNSRLMTFRFRGLAKLTGRNMWEAFDNSIAPLPIRRIDFGDPGDRERHDELVELVHRAEPAVRAARTAQSATERAMAGRRVDGLARRLEDLVLDLYGVDDLETRHRVLDGGAPL